MSSIESIITILAGIVAILSISLIYYIYRDKTRYKAVKKLDTIEFSTFLRTNSLDGSIQQVAGKVGDLLKSSFECDKIIFLRKKRGVLELNYYHGINRFERRDFTTKYSRELDGILRTDFLPQKIERIKDIFPSLIFDRIKEYGIDLYFPVYWRENLYGIYFFKSNLKTSDPSFNILISSLAQSLSAAYHVKWHEMKHNELLEKYEKIENANSVSSDPLTATYNELMKLTKEKDSERLVKRVAEYLYQSLGMNRIAFIYESKQDNRTEMLIKGESKSSLKIPGRDSFSNILNALDSKKTVTLDELLDKNISLVHWITDLIDLGMKYITPFPISPSRQGFVAWRGEPFSVIDHQLSFIKKHISDLIENAESFEQMEDLSYTDGLTGLSNQRYFKKRLDEEISRCHRYNRKLALIFFDLDALKQTNDKYGHLAGDDLLYQVGQILKTSIRSIDVIARYGGDEFCVIMPESDEKNCTQFMERIRSKVTNSEFAAEGVDGFIKCTISLGAAVYPNHAKEAKKLIYAADMALLKAKEQGRDKFLIHNQS